MKKNIFLMLLFIPLMGCQQMKQQQNQYVRDRSKDYLISRVSAPLVVPDPLSYPNATEYYPVPEPLPVIGTLEPVSLVPPGFGELSAQS